MIETLSKSMFSVLKIFFIRALIDLSS